MKGSELKSLRIQIIFQYLIFCFTMLSEETLNYLRSAVDIAVLPGSESFVSGGSGVVSHATANSVFVSGALLLKSGDGFASDAERLAATEQVFAAALETGRLAEAKRLLEELERRFPSKLLPAATSSTTTPSTTTPSTTTTNPNTTTTITFTSLRVVKLRGLLLEAEARYDDALALYDQALAQDETYAPIIKRKVAVLVDQGRTNDAIATLNHYLDHFHADLEAWTTLSNLYLRNLMFQQAAFAVEECMILGGFNFLYHIRYAEINMTLNKPAVALKYFCGAVEVTESTGGSLRAWYGIRQATRALIDSYESGHSSSSGKTISSSSPAHGKKGSHNAASQNTTASIEESVDKDIVSPDEWKALNTLAGEKIVEIYKSKKASSENTAVVSEWLKIV
ncbi:UNVERIFIED_CONTAM: hypothetical protein HDU68_007104 [Siphonaria sp. JEL0065]|nr:hypothetical protein HDU68_007104 [Siphonaria sp. JEL0065]